MTPACAHRGAAAIPEARLGPLPQPLRHQAGRRPGQPCTSAVRGRPHWYGSVISLWAEVAGESALVVAVPGVALVVAAPVGPALDFADDTQRDGLGRGDDQAVDQAADLG